MPKIIKFSSADCNDIVHRYKSGESSNSISKSYPSYTPGVILRRLKKLGIPIRQGTRKYTINHDFIKTIDTEEKAYFLGFIFADGHNDLNRSRISINLQYNDEDILIKFKKCINSNVPISYNHKPNRKPQCVLRLN